MQTRCHALILACALLVACGTAAPGRDSARASAAIALTNVTLIDGTGDAPKAGVTIVVERGRIAAIHEAGGKVPDGARVVDLAGHWVIPGLIDAHVHLATFERGELHPALLRNQLMGGVTTVRDMGGNVDVVARLARGSTDTSVAPRIYYSAVMAGPRWFATYDSTRIRYWSGSHAKGSAPGVRLVDATSDIDALVADAARTGATGIKLYSDIPADRIEAIAKAAHARGMRVWAHAFVPPVPPARLAELVDVMTHADQLAWAGAGPADTLWSREARSRLFTRVKPDGPEMDALLANMRAHETLLEPTLLVMSGHLVPGAEGRTNPAGDSIARFAAAATGHAHRRGIPIVAGTDAMGTTTPGIHSELQLLVAQAGLTPMDAIVAATRNAARAIGAEDSLGTLAVGKLADLVVLRADPTADIANTRAVTHVMRGGVLRAREEPERER